MENSLLMDSLEESRYDDHDINRKYHIVGLIP